MRCVNTTATHPLRSATGTLTSATGAFLFVGLGATTRNFTADLRLVRAKACIRHLTDISLVHQIHVNWGLKDRRGEFNLTKLFAFYVKNIYFHGYLAPYPQRLLLSSLFDYNQTAFAARHCTVHAE